MGKKYFFGVLSYFKNERNILNEWILHYKIGESIIYGLLTMVQKMTNDISEYLDSDLVTIFSESQLGQQDAYNKYLLILKPDVK